MGYALILASRVTTAEEAPPVEGAMVVQCLGCQSDVWLEPNVVDNAAEYATYSEIVIACVPCYNATRQDLAREEEDVTPDVEGYPV